MVALCPFALIVPLRAAPLLAATEKAITPLPLPDAPPVMVIQLAFDVADQLQLLAAVTLMLPPPLPEPNDCDVGESPTVHGVGPTPLHVAKASVSWIGLKAVPRGFVYVFVVPACVSVMFSVT